jgi:DNA-binding MarR family transcriptional regulator
VIAVLPWFQPLIKSFEWMGLKVELQEMRRDVDRALVTAAEAKTQTRELETAVVGKAGPDEAASKSQSVTPEERAVLERLARPGGFRFRTLTQLADEISMEPKALAPILTSLLQHGIVGPLGNQPSQLSARRPRDAHDRRFSQWQPTSDTWADRFPS